MLLCGVARRELPGASLFSITDGAAPSRPVVSEYHAIGSTTGAHMLRFGRYKYCHCVTHRPQLFDVEADCDELNDVPATRVMPRSLQKASAGDAQCSTPKRSSIQSPNGTVARLTAAAYNTALETDDFSLVGLAARVKDAVVLTAARESVVLYAESLGSAFRPRSKYVWTVDEDLAQHARRFIDAFNTLFGEKLPPPDQTQAERYWHAYTMPMKSLTVVRLGYDDGVLPTRHYHWGICRTVDEELEVQDFWKPEVWTTTRYSSALSSRGRCPEL